MVLFFTTPEDSTIDTIIAWLNHFNFRNYQKVFPLDIAKAEILAHIGDESKNSKILGIDVCDIKVCFFWKGGGQEKSSATINSLDKALSDFSTKEYDEIETFVFNRIINSSKWINHPNFARISKLEQLIYAQEVGFMVPVSRIINRQYSIPDGSITKTVSGNFFYQEKEGIFRDFTTRIIRNAAPDCFMPSFIQEEVPKACEIRVLYAFGEIFSFCISEAEPDIDYRRNLYSSGVKFSLCIIPVSLKRKINRYMRLLKLQMGSLDFIKSISGEYYFLEVNPSGQFRKLSEMFNLAIEKAIALKIMEMHQ